MTATRRATGRPRRSSPGNRVPENAIARYGTNLRGQALVSREKLAERLRRALEAAGGSVQKASRLGKYQLTTIQLTCSLKAGFVLLEAGGALTLSWTLPKPAPGGGGSP